LAAALAVFALAAPAFPQNAPGPGASAIQSGDYAKLLARLKGGDVGIDFKALRAAYASSPDYHPYGGDAGARHAMISSFKAGRCGPALEAAGRVLDTDYLDLDAQYVSASCQATLGNAGKAAFHKAAFLGLLNAILSTGDGKSPASAYTVLAAPEEYTVTGYLGLRPTGQSLVRLGGHAFDRLDVTSQRPGGPSSLYFNVDVPLAWLNRSLSRGPG
jgi:hypothetical protein